MNNFEKYSGEVVQNKEFILAYGSSKRVLDGRELGQKLRGHISTTHRKEKAKWKWANGINSERPPSVMNFLQQGSTS